VSKVRGYTNTLAYFGIVTKKKVFIIGVKVIETVFLATVVNKIECLNLSSFQC
jgi:hypothetical protein